MKTFSYFNTISLFFIAWPLAASQPAPKESEPLISLRTVDSVESNSPADRRTSILDKIHAAAQSTNNLRSRNKERLKTSINIDSGPSSNSHPSDNSSPISPQSKKSRTYQVVEYGSILTLFSTFIYLKISEAKTPSKRFFTGLEPMGIGLIFKGVAGYAIPAILTVYSGYKINRWLHRQCRSDFKKTEESFEKKLEKHANQVDQEIKRIDDNVETLAKHTEELANTLLEYIPLSQTQTDTMHSMAQEAENIQNQSKMPVKIKPSTKCCKMC